MADQDQTPTFETDSVQADRAREQGLGFGERELNAQRDPGGVRTANVEPGEEDNGDAPSALDESLGVQGAPADEGAMGREEI